MAKTILITGSTGYVCKHLINKILSETSYSIVTTYRNEKGYYEQNDRLFFEQANLNEPKSFDRIFNSYKPAYFVHLAAMARVKDGELYPAESINTNLIASIQLINLCNKFRVKTAVVASSNLAQNAVSVVGISKLLIEQYIQKQELGDTKLVCYRVPNVIDSNGAVTNIFRKQIENNQPITVTDKRMSRMFTTGDQAASEILYLLENGKSKGVYVSYNKPVMIYDLAKKMISASGKNIPIEVIGMKPGEKLSEHCFSKSDVTPTSIPYLGSLKNYNHNPHLVDKSIASLKSKLKSTEGKSLYRELLQYF